MSALWNGGSIHPTRATSESRLRLTRFRLKSECLERSLPYKTSAPISGIEFIIFFMFIFDVNMT